MICQYSFRKGAGGALLDEYEKAINELKNLIVDVDEYNLTIMVDKNTEDPDCHSIQSILTHVVQSGYTYVIEIRKWLGENIDYKTKTTTLSSSTKYNRALDEMFLFNKQLFEDYPNLLFEPNPSKKIKTRWGQFYDVEQLFEHAIVHVLRHRRQIEKFLLAIKEID